MILDISTFLHIISLYQRKLIESGYLVQTPSNGKLCDAKLRIQRIISIPWPGRKAALGALRLMYHLLPHCMRRRKRGAPLGALDPDQPLAPVG